LGKFELFEETSYAETWEEVVYKPLISPLFSADPVLEQEHSVWLSAISSNNLSIFKG